MEEVWVVYLCLILLIIVLVLMKQNPHVEEAKKERESKSSPPPSSFSPSNVGKKLEHSQEELESYLDRLTHVLFDTEARRRDGPHDQKSHHHHHRSADVMSEAKADLGKEAARSQYPSSHTRVQAPQTLMKEAKRPIYLHNWYGPQTDKGVGVFPLSSGTWGQINVVLPEQAVQEAVDTNLHVRRRQHQTASKRYHEGYWPETAVQPETDTS